jgi:hypothetical protein
VGNGIGILINGGSGNTIGGSNPDPTKSGPGNLICFNATDGVQLQLQTAVQNMVGGNEIEFNGEDGIDIFSQANGNTIGGQMSAAEPGNMIVGNSGNGIEINGADTNYVEGNSIGVDGFDGAFGNSLNGVVLENDAWGNWIGMADGGSIGSYSYGNIISGNGQDGVLVTKPIQQNYNAMNFVEGNLIGIGSDGSTARPNSQNGVEINQVVGTVVSGNVISGNSQNGLQITGNTVSGTVIATQTAVTNNLIGTNATGKATVGNGWDGIYLYLADQNTIGGQTFPPSGQTNQASNVISGNAEFGMEIGSSSNLVVNNYIGTDISGTMSLGNQTGGVNIGWNPNPGLLMPPKTVTAANNTIGGSGGDVLGGGLNSTLNVISGNNGPNGGLGQGISMYGGGVQGTLIEGNYIGVDVTGDTALGNANSGIFMGVWAGVPSPTNTTIGGTTLAAGNVISGNGVRFNVGGNGFGVDVIGTGLLQNNNIGYDADEFDPELLINQGGGVTLPPSGWTSTGNLVQ